MSRAQALRVLALSSRADRDDVKRAYRRLAREHHPDHGGDPDTFHEVARAFQRLDDDTRAAPPTVSPGRPSRSPTGGSAEAAVDLTSIDWATPVPDIGTRLDRDRLAVALTRTPTSAVAPVTAISRSPGSRLNGLAPHLAGNATASLAIYPDSDDRRKPVVAVQIRARTRRARRALETAELQGRWARLRGSSSTVLRSTFAPASEPRISALLATDRAATALDGLDWGLAAWTLADDAT